MICDQCGNGIKENPVLYRKLDFCNDECKAKYLEVQRAFTPAKEPAPTPTQWRVDSCAVCGQRRKRCMICEEQYCETEDPYHVENCQRYARENYGGACRGE